MPGDLNLVGEVRRVAKNHLGLGLELHLGLDAGHGGLDTGGLAALVQDLVDLGVKHVRATVYGRQTSETLGQLAETVQRVDVRRLSVPGYRVSVHPNTVDSLGSLAGLVKIGVVQVEGHGVPNEISGAGLEAEFVEDFLRGTLAYVETYNVISPLFNLR